MTLQQHVNWQERMLGRYQLLQVVGSGSIGEVWLADDTQSRRHVAIKLLPAVLADNNNYLQDFKYESRAITALDHPHILPIHDFGEQVIDDEVTTYLVMPYITGGSLRDRIGSIASLLPIEEVLVTLKQAAEAIDYAHSQHVLHGDIKPSNMLLQNGWLLLADFGLAKLLLSSTYRSRTHAGVGTPEYIAPEQAMGKAEAASDRYSLAIIAYQAFTGQVPFRGETPYDTLIQHIRETPPTPRQFNPNIPQQVEETLLQGIAKHPEERPVSCLAFVHALERGWNLNQQLPSVDSEATVLAPWNKHLRANRLERPRLSAPLFTPLPAELTNLETVQRTIPETPTYMPTVVSVPTQFQTPVETQKMSGTPDSEPRETHIGRRTLLIGGAAAAIAATAIVGGVALPALLHHSSPTPKPPLIPGPKHLIPGVPVLNLTGHSDKVWNVVWDPTGRYIATAGEDTRTLLWDVGNALQKSATSFQTLTIPTNSWKFSGPIYNNSVCWSADGRALLVTLVESDVADKIHFIDPFRPNKTSIYTNINDDKNTTSGYRGIAWRPNTQSFAAAVFTTPASVQVEMWDAGHAQQASKTFRYKAPDEVEADQLAWSYDGTILAANLNNSTIVVWEIKTGKVLQAITLPDRTNNQYVQFLRDALAWSPTDPNVLLVSDVDVCVIVNVKQNKVLHILGTDNHDAITVPKPNPNHFVPNILGLAWSPNGRYIVGGYGRTAAICLWDLQNKTPTIKNGIHIQEAYIPASSGKEGQNDIVIDVAWSPDGRYLASASADKTVLVWKMDK